MRHVDTNGSEPVGLAGTNILVTGGAGFIGSHLVDALVGAGPASLTVVDSFFLGKEENLAGARSVYPDLVIERIDARIADLRRTRQAVAETLAECRAGRCRFEAQPTRHAVTPSGRPRSPTPRP